MSRHAASAAPRLPLWQALRLREEPASVPELAREIGAEPAVICWRLSRWVRAGFLSVIHVDPASQLIRERDPDGRFLTSEHDRARYTMNDNSRSLRAPPAITDSAKISEKRGGRDRMWRTIRILKRFDLVQLQLAASVTQASAKTYVSALVRAGILQRVARGCAGSGDLSVYAVAGRTGPRTPVVKQHRGNGQRGAEVFDPNTGETHDISSRRAAAADPFFDDGN